MLYIPKHLELGAGEKSLKITTWTVFMNASKVSMLVFVGRLKMRTVECQQ